MPISTWRGERGEEWSSAQGLESILISIQSLMSSNPYENEPGFENANSSEDKKNIAHYVAKVPSLWYPNFLSLNSSTLQIRHETLRISIIQRLEDFLGIHSDGTVDELPSLETQPRTEYDEDVEQSQPPFEPFKDLCKRRFLWYYDSYISSINKAEKTVKENEAFVIMPFEGGGNSMAGKFNYTELRRRLSLIYSVLNRETQHWVNEGLVQVRKETSLASGLERQFQHIVETYKKNDMVTLDISLHENNPFVWLLTYFGRPMTHLDGGMFRIRMSFSPRFPDEQPRVVFETVMFHHRISKGGVLCYFPRRPEDIRSHIEAIIESLEEPEPPYDPRTLVNPEASKLFWGSVEDKKQYNRQLRRAVQRSME